MRILSFIFSLAFLGLTACSGDSGTSASQADFSGAGSVESLQLSSSESKTAAPGAAITVTNSAETIDGTLTFQGGATLIFEGDATINGTFAGTTSDSVVIVAKGNLTFGENFSYTAANSIKIVSDIADAQSDDEIIADSAVDKGEAVDGNIVGNIPLPPPTTASMAPHKADSALPRAQVRPPWRVRGNYSPSPIDRTRPFVFLLFPRNRDVEFIDVNITVPDALNGTDETKEGTATGTDADQTAPSLRIKVPGGKFTADNFTVKLANGGKGGDATAIPTQTLCDTTAIAGKGGPSGNLKITAKGAIDIKKMTITPGKSGDGGKATATGCTRPRCSKKDGGTATATGGAGADNKKVLRTRGVTGVDNITINDVVAGDGGDAVATGGNGSDDEPTGFAGGTATATAGIKGEASVTADVPATATNGKDGTTTETNGNKGADVICTAADTGDATPTPAHSFVDGSYTGDNGCGILSTTVSVDGNNVTFTPYGNGVDSQTFVANDNSATASGATVFQQPNHTVTLTISDDGNTITHNATNNTTGGTCSETLTKR